MATEKSLPPKRSHVSEKSWVGSPAPSLGVSSSFVKSSATVSVPSSCKLKIRNEVRGR